MSNVVPLSREQILKLHNSRPRVFQNRSSGVTSVGGVIASRISQDLSDKLQCGILTENDSQLSLLEQYDPLHPMLNVCRANFAMEKGDFKAAARELYSFDVGIDTSASWCGMGFIHELYSRGQLDWMDAYQFISCMSEVQAPVYWDFQDFLEERVMERIEKRNLAEDDDCLSFIDFFSPDSAFSLTCAHYFASTGSLKRAEELMLWVGDMEDDVDALLHLEVYDVLAQKDSRFYARGAELCRNYARKYPDSEQVIEKISEMCPQALTPKYVPPIRGKSGRFNLLQGETP